MARDKQRDELHDDGSPSVEDVRDPPSWYRQAELTSCTDFGEEDLEKGKAEDSCRHWTGNQNRQFSTAANETEEQRSKGARG